MHRLVNTKNISKTNFKVLSESKWGSCCGCTYFGKTYSIFNRNNIEQYILLRKPDSALSLLTTVSQQSSTPNADLINIQKSKKRRTKNKKFTELLQINSDSCTQTKASVQKLKSKQLSDFIDKPELICLSPSDSSAKMEYTKYSLMKLQLDELQSKFGEESPIIFVGKDSVSLNKGTELLLDIIYSYTIFMEINGFGEYPNIIPEGSGDFIPKDETIFLEEDAEANVETDHLEAIENEVIANSKKNIKTSQKSTYKSKQHQTLEHEQLAKQQTLATNLSAYLEMCVSRGMVNRGFATLLFYRYKCKQSKLLLNIMNVKLYNILLSGYAEKINFGKMKEILAVLNEDKIAYTPQTFAAIFECLGRMSSNSEKTMKLTEFQTEAILLGITFNDILDKSKFINNKRDIVIEAIRRIEPLFVPVYTPPMITYNNELLSSLNQFVKPVNEKYDTNLSDVPGSEIMMSKNGFSKDELICLYNKQLTIEIDSLITIRSIEKFPEINDIVLHYRKNLEILQKLWRSQISHAFTRDLNTLRSQMNSKGNRHINLMPYLKSLDVDQFTDILMHEIRQLAAGSESFSLTVGQLYRILGGKVQAKYQMERKKQNGILEKTDEVYSGYCEALSNSFSTDNPRQIWQRIVYQTRSTGASMDIHDRAWPLAATIGVGRFLYQILMRDVKINTNVIRPNSKSEHFMPAFYTLFRNERKFVKEEVKPHPVLARLHRGSQQETLSFPTNTVPMLCPPQPWSTPYNGGYLLARSELIRLPHQAYQQWERINAAPLHDMYPSLDSLNQLASVPWRINTKVLDTILNVFNTGGSKKLDVPQPSCALQPPIFATPDNDPNLSKTEKFQRYRQMLNHRRVQSEMYSLWCDTLYRLSLANHYRDVVFWLPHNMDFRGRVYPIPPHLNHLGADLARSLLIFHKKRPLGTDGFSWIKLHCINLTGLKKKSSTTERLLYAEKVMDDIIDSAQNPLTGRMWWAKSEEPWQTLAACIEIDNISRCPDPTKYMSSFPVHQDGSCNGLQHYAALGRDTAGAINVNLTPATVPQDVYSAVAALVEESRAADEKRGDEIAKILNGYVRRKVIKQTVMTTVYGVTRYGARVQIARQLKDIESFPKDWIWPASAYLTAKTFDSLREMFTSTREIQDWFTYCARLIAAIGGHNVEWITPLGLPVVQPYNRFEKTVTVPKAHKLSDRIAMDSYSKPNVMKQKNAFPPNFIHSLDSSHMMLTSLHCEKFGLTFISVHDCYWTHACTVPDMNKICRQQFVSLHSQPILEDLSKYLVEKYSYSEKEFRNDGSVLDSTKRKLNKTLKNIPQKGTFDLQNVLESVYFFS